MNGFKRVFKQIAQQTIAMALMLAPLICLAATQKGSTARPNILLIVSEDNGPDLGCYGNKNVNTPVLDRLAAEGVRFENAFVTYSVCSPSRSSIFTGLYPHQNGQTGLATHKYHMYPGMVTMPVYLKKAGYRTGCIGKIHVNPESAIPFDFRPAEQDPLAGDNFSRKNMKAYATVADHFINNGSDPFFLMVNYPDAHFPFVTQTEGMPARPLTGDEVSVPPFVGADSKRLRGFTANYYNCMERLDEMVGDLLTKLQASGKAENTLIMYLGDHGAQFSRGKCSNYEAGLKIPLIVKWPGKTAVAAVRKELVSALDLLPTILNAARISIPPSLPGKPLQPLLFNKERHILHEYIFAEGDGSAAMFYYPRRSVRNNRFKLIHNLLFQRENPKFYYYANNIGHFGAGTRQQEIEASPAVVQNAYATWKHPPEFELYDLEKDPYEFHNLSANPHYAKVLHNLKKVLFKWQQQTADPLSDKNILDRFTQEVDSVNQAYPGHDYPKDPNFQWRYPVYFFDYIKSRARD
ncbi:sulfatase [Niabella insulamsoli]|uniref:sulfatase family protein n=1 Tax=Niabella insulamsoli TaxID=3144874 RepID=UPI0031FDFB27